MKKEPRIEPTATSKDQERECSRWLLIAFIAHRNFFSRFITSVHVRGKPSGASKRLVLAES